VNVSVPGFDFSSYQDDPATPAFIDFAKAKAGGMEFAIARAAYGLAKDRIFPRGFDEAQKAGLITGVYQFADYRTYAKNNVEALAKILGDRRPAFVMLDLEENQAFWPGMWPSNGAYLTTWVWDYFNAFQPIDFGGPLVLYTNLNTIQQMRASFQSLTDFAKQVPLWFAWYDPSEPHSTHYAPWTKWHFKQPRPSAVGRQFGMESGNLDTDVWNGTLEELKAFVTGSATALDPPGGVSDAEKLKRLWAEHPELH
jgi:GH25 family lysozyme M1 (1,4-beta-N-acetylmuramidase)